jgi:mono/diheme cytochrome c family protein
MRILPILLLLALTAQAFAQNALYDSGAKVFKLSCAQGYCHGSGGTQGRAPKLIGRNYDAAAVRKIIEGGVPGTGMPAFKDRLDAEQLTAVLFYVVQISGGDTSRIQAAAAAGGKQAMPPLAAAGKAAFFDALKGVHRCSTCHALEDTGLAVGPNLSSGGPYDAAALRAGRDATVKLVTAGADTFVAILASEKNGVTQVYDLTVTPPVLRTFAKGEMRWAGPGKWTHASAAAKAYSNEELNAVAAYLKWIAER